MKINLKYILITLTIVFFIISGLIWYILHQNKIIKDKENAILAHLQNEAALKDYIAMQADSIQDYAISVKNLKTESNNFKNKYTLLKNKHYILIDSVKKMNQLAIIDTSGNTITISFEGREGKVLYKGQTTYFKLTSEGIYSIEIGVDPLKVESEIYFDKNNNLIKNKIYIDGALIDSARTEIDSTLYILIKNNKLDIEEKPGFFDRLHLLAEIGTQVKKENITYVSKKLYLPIGVEYQFDKFRIFSKFDIINQDINVGIQYHPSIKDIWKTIFRF